MSLPRQTSARKVDGCEQWLLGDTAGNVREAWLVFIEQWDNM